MDVQIQSVHFTADKKLIGHVEKKVEKLKTFSDSITNVEVYLKLENMSTKIKEKIAEIKVSIPKLALFAKHESKSFEESFDMALDSMIAQIKKHKQKQNTVAQLV